jgi:nucleoside-diphosphate-sugar epimerase
VCVTFNVGHDDAERVVEEIRRGGGNADSVPADVLEVAPFDSMKAKCQVDTIYYFASPTIQKTSRKDAFSTKAFLHYAEFYVGGLFRTVQALRGSELIKVFYPSTVFIDELPAGFAEYVTAKSAGETLCAQLSSNHEDVDIYIARLPRMATDQTVVLSQSSVPSAMPGLLSEIRAFQG